MKFEPHVYQADAIDFLHDTKRSSLWMGMGMGKTVSTLTVLANTTLDHGRPALVLAPKRVARSTWPNEVAKWDHLRGLDVTPLIGTAQERTDALRQDTPIHTINYDNLPWLIDTLKALGRKWPYDTVVADESTRLKSHRTRGGGRRAKALASVAHTRVERWINLTGTPAPNGLIDLWGQQWFVDAGERLGRTFTSFADRWFQRGHEMKELSGGREFKVPIIKPASWAQQEIEDRLKDVTLTKDPADYFDLEEPIVRRVEVDLPPRARSLYRDMEKHMFMELAGFEVEAVHAASKTMKCLQLASGAAYVDDTGQWREVHDEKLQALESILEEAAGMPVLVAYHWKPDLARTLKAFPFARELKTKQDEDDWNAGKIRMLLAHPGSAGHGLNLQDGGNIIVYFSHWWDLEQHDQILERIGPVRQLQAGYKRPVWVYYIVARKTVDELVMVRRETKRSVQSILMEAMKRAA